MTFPTQFKPYNKRSTLGREAGAALLKKSLSYGATFSNPPVPMKDFAASRIATAQRDAKLAEAGKLRDKPATDIKKRK